MDCAIEPDLKDGDREFGSHCKCDECLDEENKNSPKLNSMLKGYDRCILYLLNHNYKPSNFYYFNSDQTHHTFRTRDNKASVFISIEDGDFDLDFDRYNGFKK